MNEASPQGGAFFILRRGICELVSICCDTGCVKQASDTIISFEKTARRDLRWWMMLVIGAMFLGTAMMVPPQSNCNASGECAPWLIPVAGMMGALALAMAFGQLAANMQRGSKVDFAAGTIEWWQGRTARHPGDHGAIALEDIASIRIQHRDEGANAVSLYDRAGERQAFFDEEVIPWRQEEWARRVIAQVPGIELDLRD